ncbi:hypothetical protein [Vitiosangium sp. GDMCC 1.1324]|uniref:hypothetical protein n=1 Tax=Vitiosangium sp. (strain GDMCC 1.1324) TaxID=2138576 RepID=UPI000D34373C|nr:hypothetical protein [Vitiosangium sp. GDMCC 1.1324]PTL78468.1 hypothetical protein DAT35_38715 [Vitiosangium sp. GDMCC 1.1324]
MSRRAPSWLLLVLLVFAGCSRCGEKQVGATAANPARFLPRGAQASVVVPDLGALGEKLARFQKLKLANFVAQLQNASSAESYVSSIMRQVGVDLRSRQAMEAAGIDPARGAGASLLGGDQAFSVLGVKDEKTLTATFAKLARERLGASQSAESKVPGGTLVTFSRPNAQQPSLGLLFTEGYALLGAGAMVSQLSGYATMPAEKSLLQEPLLTASLNRLPAERDFYAFLPGGIGFLIPAGTTQSVTVAGSLGERAVTLRLDTPWPDTQASLAALTPQQAPELLGYLPEDSFFVARYRGDPSQLSGIWPYLVGSSVTQAVQQSGFDLKGEVLDKLKPGLVAGVSLAPTAQLGGGMPSLDPRRTNPFRFIHLVVVGESKDAAAFASTLEKVPPVAQRFGAEVKPTDINGQRVYFTSYRQGEGAHFAEVGDKVVLAAPQSRLEAALTRLKGPAGKSPVAEDVRSALQGPVLGAVLDLNRLSDSVRALPSEAWGIGGFAIKATTVRWLDATDDLRAVTLGLSEKEKALQAELTLWLAPH